MNDELEEYNRASEIFAEAGDPFRLVIRGNALIEEVVDEAIDNAFKGTPAQLKHLRLAARLSLAEALELITPEVAKAVTALAKIRNRLAHGVDADVTDEDVRSLRRAVEPFGEPDDSWDDYPGESHLPMAIATIWVSTRQTVDFALGRRAEAEAALAAWAERHVLSREQVDELLRIDDASVTEIEDDVLGDGSSSK